MRMKFGRAGMLGLVVVIGAASVLVMHVLARIQISRLEQALQPWAQLSHGGARITLDGGLRINAPRVQVLRGPWRGELRARAAHVHLPRRWDSNASTNNGVPTAAELELLDPQLLPAKETDIDRLLAQLPMLAAVTGCTPGASAPAAASSAARVRYRLDEHDRLDFSLSLEAAPYPTWQVHSTVSGLARATAESHTSLRVQRIDIAAIDDGWFKRHVSACAKQTSSSTEVVVERQVDKLIDWLGQHDIDANLTVVALYRRWLQTGGKLALTGLPDASLHPDQLAAYPRDTLLRLLNTTLRLQDQPPIMLGLGFRDPDRPLLDAALVWEAPAKVDPATATTLTESAPEMAAKSAAPTPASTQPESGSVAPLATELPPEVADPASAVVEAPQLDAPAAVADPTSIRELGPSGERPTDNSALALVWKEDVIERLPPAPAVASSAPWIALDALSDHVGDRVQVVLRSGRRVDGRIVSKDTAALQLSVRGGAGEAMLAIPIGNIAHVRLVTARERVP